MGHLPSKEVSSMPFAVDLQGAKGQTDRLLAVALTTANFPSVDDPLFQQFVQLRADPNVTHWFNVADPSSRDVLPPAPSAQYLFEKHVIDSDTFVEQGLVGDKIAPIPIVVFRLTPKEVVSQDAALDPLLARASVSSASSTAGLSTGEVTAITGGAYSSVTHSIDGESQGGGGSGTTSFATSPQGSLLTATGVQHQQGSTTATIAGKKYTKPGVSHDSWKDLQTTEEFELMGYIGIRHFAGRAILSMFQHNSLWNEAKSLCIFQLACKCYEHFSTMCGMPQPVWPKKLQTTFPDTNLPMLRVLQKVLRDYTKTGVALPVVSPEDNRVCLQAEGLTLYALLAALSSSVTTVLWPGTLQFRRFCIGSQRQPSTQATQVPTAIDGIVEVAKTRWAETNAIVLITKKALEEATTKDKALLTDPGSSSGDDVASGTGGGAESTQHSASVPAALDKKKKKKKKSKKKKAHSEPTTTIAGPILPPSIVGPPCWTMPRLKKTNHVPAVLNGCQVENPFAPTLILVPGPNGPTHVVNELCPPKIVPLALGNSALEIQRQMMLVEPPEPQPEVVAQTEKQIAAIWAAVEEEKNKEKNNEENHLSLDQPQLKRSSDKNEDGADQTASLPKKLTLPVHNVQVPASTHHITSVGTHQLHQTLIQPPQQKQFFLPFPQGALQPTQLLGNINTRAPPPMYPTVRGGMPAQFSGTATSFPSAPQQHQVFSSQQQPAVVNMGPPPPPPSATSTAAASELPPAGTLKLGLNTEATVLLPVANGPQGLMQAVPIKWCEVNAPLKKSNSQQLRAPNQSESSLGLLLELVVPSPSGTINVITPQQGTMSLAIPHPCYINVAPGAQVIVM